MMSFLILLFGIVLGRYFTWFWKSLLRCLSYRSLRDGILHTRLVSKPWGKEEIWANTSEYAGKILNIRAGESLSKHYHRVKDETLMVLQGCAKIHLQNFDEQWKDILLEEGNVYRIFPGVVHQIEAVTDCKILEVSSPELEDLVRLADRYGRS